MSPCKPLVQEVSAHELLRRRLHQHCEKYREQRQRFEAVKDEINVAVNDRDEDTKSILSASDEHAQQEHFQRVALCLGCECFCHGAVTFRNKFVAEENDPLTCSHDVHDEHI